nr:MAG TPA: hypothetical protein [Caudoviricetes sp.]
MSETDFLKLKKHDNVETNTEKFDIENYLNGNWDKINENAKKTNNQILQLETEKTKLEKELKEAQEDFYQNSIRGQASGEYIHVEDSSNCRSIIGIGGNHEQEMRSGKNYLNTLAKYKAGEKVTVDGITYIFNEDGSITCNGTATADSVLTFSSNLQTINGSGKKIVGMLTGTQVPKKLSILAYTSDWSKNTFELLSSVNKNITINMQENIDYTIFRIIAYKGTTLNNQTIYYQILDTSVNDLTYEQYGASPSLDYPSPIKAVGSNINLFNKDNMTIGKIWNGATLLDSDVGNASPNIPVTAGKTYIRNAGYSSNYIIKENNSVVDVQGGTNAITMPEDAKYWMFNIPKDIDINTIKAEEGSISTLQSKYGQGSVKVTKCNKNLLDSSILENKILDSKTGSATTNTSWKASDFIQINSGIYNFSWKSSSNYFQVTICFYDRNKNFLSGISWAIANVYSKSFEVDENTTFIRVSYSTIISGKEANREKIILEQSSTETDYEQHEEQSYIIPVQSEMLEGDYFGFDNEEEVHTWNKLTLNGTENITLNSNYNDCTLFELVKSDCYIPTDTKKYAISNHFISGNKDLLASNNGINMVGLGTSRGRIWINVSNSIVGTSDKLNNFKTLLKSKYDAGTPVVIYYKLATPNRLKFTDEQKAVAKELNNARTYKNVTNITTDSKAILSLDYTKDLETQNQKMQNEIDEIKQLLSTTQTSAMLLDNLQKEVESEVE